MRLRDIKNVRRFSRRFEQKLRREEPFFVHVGGKENRLLEIEREASRFLIVSYALKVCSVARFANHQRTVARPNRHCVLRVGKEPPPPHEGGACSSLVTVALRSSPLLFLCCLIGLLQESAHERAEHEHPQSRGTRGGGVGSGGGLYTLTTKNMGARAPGDCWAAGAAKSFDIFYLSG